jgi:polyhydroxybutyrate depolymerase
MVGNLTRYYLLYIPTNYDPEVPLPVVFGIHGYNMNNVWAAHDQSGFQLIEATQNKAILIYPQGLTAGGQSPTPSSQSQWGTADSCWGGPPPSANTQRMTADIAYIDAILDYVGDNYCVDTDHVYSMGFSQGGFMTNTLGCERPDVFRALAPVAGWGPYGTNPSCSNQNAKHAVFQTQGTTDGTVTPQMGEATRDFWRTRSGCTTMTMTSSLGQGCVEYQGCDEGKPVIYCTHGGDHFVPSGTGARAWNFFESLD